MVRILEAVTDGQRLDLGNGCWLIPVATPRHTPDHHSYLLECDGELCGLFSGGSLMVGVVGRTDLAGPDLAEPLAHQMFHSLHRFDELPDDLAVYPTHGAGSFCSAPGSTERTTTLGRERATNPFLSIDIEDEFVEQLLGGFGAFPSYFLRLPETNRRGPTVFDAIPTLNRLRVETRQCLVVGHENLLGELDGGIDAWAAAGRPVATIGIADAFDMAGTVIDARQRNEYVAGHVPAASNVELGAIADMSPPTGPVTVMCGHGERATTAASILTTAGHREVSVFDGGPDTWSAATGLDLEVGP